ncbi:MAG: hypothetical protein V7637_1352 [Mycobacteriales bacterium]|jgi:hypothetical protein
MTDPRPAVTPTRVRDLLLIAVVTGGLAWLVIRGWYGDLPRLRWFVPLSLALLAFVELITGTQLRARIRRKPGTVPVPPLAAARALALAKASAIVGAAMVGVWSGLLLFTVPRLDYLAAAGSDTRTGVIGVVAALALVGAALWLEFCCRTPKPPDERTERAPNGLRPPG